MSGPPDLKVVQLRATALTDIPGQLRKLAAEIEAGKHGEAESMAAVLLSRAGAVELFGWGEVPTRLIAIGLFTMAATRLAQTTDETATLDGSA
jgi:hypothetical protein